MYVSRGGTQLWNLTCFFQILSRIELVLQLGQTRVRRRAEDSVPQILLIEQPVERHHAHPIRQDARGRRNVGRTHVLTGMRLNYTHVRRHGNIPRFITVRRSGGKGNVHNASFMLKSMTSNGMHGK